MPDDKEEVEPIYIPLPGGGFTYRKLIENKIRRVDDPDIEEKALAAAKSEDESLDGLDDLEDVVEPMELLNEMQLGFRDLFKRLKTLLNKVNYQGATIKDKTFAYRLYFEILDKLSKHKDKTNTESSKLSEQEIADKVIESMKNL